MEWHGGKMLPRGLPELIYEVTPNWILSNLKVIVHPKKAKRGSANACVGWHDNWWRINLYPTGILHSAKMHGSMFTLISFRFWKDFLEIMLHEIGHIATWRKSMRTCGRRQRYWEDWDYHEYVELLADVWCEEVKDKIASRDPRLGQPEGWIGGLAGIYLRRFIDFGKANSNSFYHFCLSRMNDYRGYRCGGQLTLTQVLRIFRSNYWDACVSNNSCHTKLLRRHVKRILPKLGITRHYIDSNGRRHFFFNYGESILVINELRRYVLENELDGFNIPRVVRVVSPKYDNRAYMDTLEFLK